jgi:GLPGLI family protein
MKFLFFLLFSTLGFSQELKVVYKSTYTDFSPEELRQIVESQNMSPAQVKGFKYYLSKAKSDIESQEIVLTTMGDKQFELLLPSNLQIDNTLMSNMAPVSLDLFNRVYALEQDKVVGVNEKDKFGVFFEPDYVEWHITSESKTILGIKCIKAAIKYKEINPGQFGRRTVEVWFAPSLNKKGGPLLYVNLPGLILEVKNQRNVITAVEIEEIKIPTIIPAKKVLISETQFYENNKEASRSIESRMKN